MDFSNIAAESPEALLARAHASFQQGRYDDVLGHCDRLLVVAPNSAIALNFRGLALARLRRYDDALASYDRSLECDPAYVEALNNRAVTLNALRRHAEALAAYEQVIEIAPKFWQAALNRGNLLVAMARRVEAVESYNLAIAAAPEHVVIRRYRGAVLLMLDQHEEALPDFEAVLAASPNDVDALAGRGYCHQVAERLPEAIVDYDRALRLQPDHVDSLARRGTVSISLRQYEEALQYFDRILAKHPDHLEANYNRACVLQELNRHDEAADGWHKVLSLDPDHSSAHWNYALLQLRTGQFDSGWKKYESRFELPWSRDMLRNYPQPRWLGDAPLEGKTILVYPEQGLGDMIQFSRYVSLLSERGASVVLEVPASLKSLMDGLPGSSAVIERGSDLPDFDLHIPLMSLPLAFGTDLESMPATTPYLKTPERYIEKWTRRLPDDGRLRVAICWAGSATNIQDRQRTIRLAALSSLMEMRDVSFISVQKEIAPEDVDALRANDGILPVGEELEDFSDTAAVLSLVDLVITVDTSVAHLAGAIGKPVWVMLKFSPDWRWLIDRDDSPWYPTARLFRQGPDNDWDPVVGEVKAALAGLVEARRDGRRVF